jgi:excisionase family DNA binding protein
VVPVDLVARGDRMKDKKTFEEKDVLTVSDIQQYLHISKDYAYSLVKSNVFPNMKIGHSYRIPKDTFLHWVQYTAKMHLKITV